MDDRTDTALAEVDDRLRSAAATLRSAVGRVDGAPVPPAPTPHVARPRRRAWLAAAAAIIVVAGVAGVQQARRPSDDSGRAVTSEDGYLVAGWLPDGFGLVRAQRPSDPAESLSLVYGPSSSSDESIAVLQAPGDDRDVGPLPIVARAERATVRGHPGLRARNDTQAVVQWAEPRGLVITVTAEGVPQSDLDRFVASLRTARSGEIDAALRMLEQATGLGDLAAGEARVTGGERSGRRWELVASDDVTSQGVSLRDDAGSSAVSMANDAAEPFASAVTGHSGGLQAVFGLVGPGVAEVVAEQPGAAPASVELVKIPGGEQRAFVVWPAGDPADVVLVFLDPSGSELGRSQ